MIHILGKSSVSCYVFVVSFMREFEEVVLVA